MQSVLCSLRNAFRKAFRDDYISQVEIPNLYSFASILRLIERCITFRIFLKASATLALGISPVQSFMRAKIQVENLSMVSFRPSYRGNRWYPQCSVKTATSRKSSASITKAHLNSTCEPSSNRMLTVVSDGNSEALSLSGLVLPLAIRYSRSLSFQRSGKSVFRMMLHRYAKQELRATSPYIRSSS